MTTTSVVQEVCDYMRHTIPDLSNEALLELVFAAAKGRGTPIDLQGLFEHVRAQSVALSEVSTEPEPVVRPMPEPGIELKSEPLHITFPDDAASPAPIAEPVEEVAKSTSRPTRAGQRTPEESYAALLKALAGGPLSLTRLAQQAGMTVGATTLRRLKHLLETKQVVKSAHRYELAK
jgi:hypothetical protein